MPSCRAVQYWTTEFAGGCGNIPEQTSSRLATVRFTLLGIHWPQVWPPLTIRQLEMDKQSGWLPSTKGPLICQTTSDPIYCVL